MRSRKDVELTGREDTACAIFTNACHMPINKIILVAFRREKAYDTQCVSKHIQPHGLNPGKTKCVDDLNASSVIYFKFSGEKGVIITYRTKLNKSCS